VRRPLPPELLALGDHLELATRHQLSRRRTRRQLVLNALASLAIALPLVATTVSALRSPVVTETSVSARPSPSFGHRDFDSPPRLLRRVHRPSDDVLSDDTTLRRALR
jgi:hypothetical protein